jgi:hypothetical protein
VGVKSETRALDSVEGTCRVELDKGNFQVETRIGVKGERGDAKSQERRLKN